MNRIKTAFSKGKAFIPFFTCGDPDLETTEQLVLAAAEAGADLIELGIPFSDPTAEGPVIQGANMRALAGGVTTDLIFGLVRRLREQIPDVVITSDVIVGFPGETTEEFEETLSLIEEVRFDALFTFIYSPRVGTPAASMPDPMSREEKLANFNRLTALQDAISEEKHAAYIGKTVRCLVDGLSDDSRYDLTARTPGNRLVRVVGDKSAMGQFKEVKITGANKWSLFGELE